jgi:copper chaperone
MKTEFVATGMTCQHCVASVTKELSEVAHITAVAVDLPTGTITVDSDVPVNVDDALAAIDKAGYSAVSR